MSEHESLVEVSRPLRLVLDTNVVMALWHFRDPALAELRAFVESERAVLLTRPECLEELQRVLAYSQFSIREEEQAALLAGYRSRSQVVLEVPFADELLPRCGDRDDQKFVELAWYGQAGALVSRDKLVLKLARRQPLRGRVAILTPERLQTELLKSGEFAP